MMSSNQTQLMTKQLTNFSPASMTAGPSPNETLAEINYVAIEPTPVKSESDPDEMMLMTSDTAKRVPKVEPMDMAQTLSEPAPVTGRITRLRLRRGLVEANRNDNDTDVKSAIGQKREREEDDRTERANGYSMAIRPRPNRDAKSGGQQTSGNKGNDTVARKGQSQSSKKKTTKKTKNNETMLDPYAEEEYEVERILAKRHVGMRTFYLIKWKNFPDEYNTWEPYANLNCKLLVAEFNHQLRRLARTKKTPLEGSIIPLPDMPPKAIQPADDEATKTKENDKQETQSQPNAKSARSNSTQRKSRATSETSSKALVKSRINETNGTRDESSRRFTICQPFHYRSAKHRENLQAIERLLAQDRGPRITVVNNVDDEGLPVLFKYINESIRGKSVPPLFDPNFLIGCDCKGRCSSAPGSTCGCLRNSDGKFAYHRHGRLRIDQGSAIYECNANCSCDATCPNRVVQRGRQVELQVFKTPHYGWGVRTLEDLPAGTYIERYLGEIITNEEAERRGHIYDDTGRTYLFDLDWHGDEGCKYVVDAYPCGNFTRFLNHSCEPNLMVIPVFITTWEVTLHQLAFFTRRPVRKYEELTFDYMGGVLIDSAEVGDDEEDSNNAESSSDGRGASIEAVSAGKKPRAKKYACLCGSAQCRKYVHF